MKSDSMNKISKEIKVLSLYLLGDLFKEEDLGFLNEENYYRIADWEMESIYDIDEYYIDKLWNVIKKQVDYLKDKDFWELVEDDERFKDIFENYLTQLFEISDIMGFVAGAVKLFKSEFNKMEVGDDCVNEVILEDQNSLDFREWKVRIYVIMECVRKYAEENDVNEEDILNDIVDNVWNDIYDVIKSVRRMLESARAYEYFDDKAFKEAFNDNLNYYAEDLINELKSYFGQSE